MKTLPCLALLLLAAACGGGGGSGPATGLTPPPQTTESALVQQLLEACGVDGTGQFQGVLDLFTGLFGTGSPAPAFRVTQINLLSSASFSWALDSNNDTIDDLTGTSQLQDANGTPSLSGLDLTQLANILGGDVSAVATLFQSLPAGTRIHNTFSGTPPLTPATDISGTVDLVLGTGGAFETSSGNFLSETGTSCSTQLTWTDLDISSLNGAGGVPSGTLTLHVETASDMLDGTIVLDGTNSAALSATRKGAPTQTYTLDLGNRTLTPN